MDDDRARVFAKQLRIRSTPESEAKTTSVSFSKSLVTSDPSKARQSDGQLPMHFQSEFFPDRNADPIPPSQSR